MARPRFLNRRSFLAQVAGGALVGTAAYAQNTAAPVETHRMAVDADPRDPGREIPPPPPPQGPSDSDSGPNSDPPGYGRTAGRSRRRAGITDSDSGANADAAGSGRGGSPTSRFVICPGNPRCPPRRP